MIEKNEFVRERLKEVWEWKDSINQEVAHPPVLDCLHHMEWLGMTQGRLNLRFPIHPLGDVGSLMSPNFFNSNVGIFFISILSPLT